MHTLLRDLFDGMGDRPEISICIVSEFLDGPWISNAVINCLVQFGCVGIVGQGPQEVLGNSIVVSDGFWAEGQMKCWEPHVVRELCIWLVLWQWGILFVICVVCNFPCHPIVV